MGQKGRDYKRNDKLKILFICSSVEPGRDGVGDYTRRLAIELIRQGHSVVALSLNDLFIAEVYEGLQHSEELDLQVLRLPATISQKNKLTIAKKYIDEFDPDWISLQFVIFGYQKKGLPYQLGKQLAAIGAGRSWHIMFHELWVGMEKATSLKYLIWGKIQRLLIKSLISKIRPKSIHTHTSLYQHQLAGLGFSSSNLALFGNIPRVRNSNIKLTDNASVDQGNTMNFVLFGHIFPNAPVEDFANEVYEYATNNKIAISLTVIGRCGGEQAVWVKKWESLNFKVNVFGEQPADVISETLESASFGLSTTPIALIEKSGTVAAMREHNLPVICVPFLWEPRGFDEVEVPAGIALYKKGNLETIFANKGKSGVPNNVTLISVQLVNSLLT